MTRAAAVLLIALTLIALGDFAWSIGRYGSYLSACFARKEAGLVGSLFQGISYMHVS